MEKEYAPIYNLGPIQIQEYQQNRHPFLMFDSVTVVLPGEYAKGYKNFTYNEWFFKPHFENDPTVPFSVQMEMMAQIFLMTFQTLPKYKGKVTAITNVKDAVFKKKIVPGDCVSLFAKLDSLRHGVAKGCVEGKIKDELVCSAYYTITVPDILKQGLPKKGGV